MVTATRKSKIQQVISANRDQIQRARELNLRAGEELFPVMSEIELRDWLHERLGGAISMETITDIDVLRLPPLDPEFLELVAAL